MKALRLASYALGRSIARLRRRPLVSGLTVVVMTIALLMVAFASLAERNLGSVSQAWGRGVHMIVYLAEGASVEHAERIRSALQELPAVEDAQYVPPEAALQNLRRSLADHGELLEGLEPGYLPASIEVSLSPGVRDLASAHVVVDRLRATPGVEEVEFLGRWVEDFTVLVNNVRKRGVWALAIASLLGIFTIISAMRLSADARLSELRVMEIMGAPATLRRGPDLIEGALLGALAAILAVVLCWQLFAFLGPVVVSALSASLGEVELSFLDVADMGKILLFGVTLGVIGGLITNYAEAR